MYARKPYTAQEPTRDEWQIVLRYLIALRQIGVKIVLAVKFGKKRDVTPERHANHKYRLYRPLVRDRKRTGVSQADRAYVHVRPLLIGIIAAITEHLGCCFEFRMHFKANGGNIVHVIYGSKE